MPNLDRELTVQYDKEYNQHPWLTGTVSPIPVERGEGIYFYDFNGKKYYDMSSQLCCVNIGYGNKDVIEAIQKQVAVLPYISPAYASAPRSELAKLLLDHAPDNMAKVFFTCGGSDANEAAINMARTTTGRSKIFSRYRSYHGSTLGSGNMSGDPRRFALENPSANGFIKFTDPYVYREKFKFANDADASAYYLSKIEEQLHYEGPHTVAAIFVETITGANGVIIPPDGYLQGLRKLCDKYGILLACDEVMAGFGRTGKMFSFEHWGIKPDIITFAKGVTSSYVQLGGVIVSREIADYYKDKVFQFGLTYSGHSLACAAGVACVEYYAKANILTNVNKVGAVLGEILEGLKKKHACIGDVRYIGLFAAVEFVNSNGEALVPYADKSGTMGKIIKLLQERGFATFGRENNINISPALIITESELRDAMKIFDETLDIVDKEFLR
ncbi:aspartate aminotransferase family protein [Clostridia bacterium]|nr:aspartate aminotransferase family protein [Clostridia bacterium]